MYLHLLIIVEKHLKIFKLPVNFKVSFYVEIIIFKNKNIFIMVPFYIEKHF